jgi:hypothetical protein
MSNVDKVQPYDKPNNDEVYEGDSKDVKYLILTLLDGQTTVGC